MCTLFHIAYTVLILMSINHCLCPLSTLIGREGPSQLFWEHVGVEVFMKVLYVVA